MVSLDYEGLHRHCFTCKMLSHEEDTCPLLTEEQREVKCRQRADFLRSQEQQGQSQFSLSNLSTGVQNRLDERARAHVPSREYQERDIQSKNSYEGHPKNAKGHTRGDLRQELSGRYV